MNNLLTAVTLSGLYFRPLLNTYHPNTTGLDNSCNLFAHKSEQLAHQASLKDVTFFDATWEDNCPKVWEETDVPLNWDVYYLMAESESGEQFFAPDLEGLPFFYHNSLHTLKMVDYGDRRDWELVKFGEFPSQQDFPELPRGNFWAH